MYQVRERILKASEQMQEKVDLRKVSVAPKQRDWERRSLSVLIAWAFPELLAQAIPSRASKGHKTDRARGRHFRLVNGAEVSIAEKDPLSKFDALAVASVSGDKVFWGMGADLDLLRNYGIDPSEPLKHKVLWRDSEKGGEDHAEFASKQISRFLAGKSCGSIQSAEDLLAFMSEHPVEFPPRDVADLIWDVARSNNPSKSLLAELVLQIVVPRVKEFAPDVLVEIASAMAVGKVQHLKVYKDLAEAILPGVKDLEFDSEGGNLASLLWAYTEAMQPYQKLFEALATRGRDGLVEFKPKVLSDLRNPCFWSFHRASSKSWGQRGGTHSSRDDAFSGFAHPKFFSILAPLVRERLQEIHPISCVYLMWSFSKSEAKMPDQDSFFDAIASRVAPDVMNLDRCGLAMFCWNFGRSKYNNAEVFEAVEKEVLRTERLAELTPRDLANIAYAFAMVKRQSPELLQALAGHGCGLLRDGLDQQCYKFPNKSLAREIYVDDFSAEDGRVDAFDMSSLSEMFFGFVTFNFKHDEFLDLADEYITKALQQPAVNVERLLRYPRLLASVLRARSRLRRDEKGRELFKIAAPHVVRVLGQLTARNLVEDLIPAWAALGPRDSYAIAAISTRLEYLLRSSLERLPAGALARAIKSLQDLGAEKKLVSALQRANSGSPVLGAEKKLVSTLQRASAGSPVTDEEVLAEPQASLPYSKASVEAMTVVQLRTALKSADLKTTGKKSELLERLLAAVKA